MPNDKTRQPIEQDEKAPSTATTPSEVWARHVFRALMSPDQLEAYERQLAAERPPDDAGEVPIGGAPGYTEDEYVPWTPPTWFPGQLMLFRALFKGLYYFLSAMARLFQGGPRTAPRKALMNRPLRVLRMVSVISQGGVAKVCLQSMLPMPAAEVEYHLLVFGEKRGAAPDLERRPDFNLIGRKILLWPSSYRFRLFRSVFKLARVIRRIRPDLIHLHEPQFAPTVRMAAILAGGVPLCVHLHNDYNERRRSIRGELLEITRHALRRSRLIACSRTILEAGRVWLEPTRFGIDLIEDGADERIETAKHDDLPDQLQRAAAGRKVVAMMTHLQPHKRITDFLNGCRILLDEGHDIFVLLMAYGKKRVGRRMRRRFNETFAPHEGEFFYRVHLPRRLMSHIDIGASTSVLEGLGLNVLEFQVEGVPVVCTDLMPHREMVADGETGLLFPGFDVPGFLRQMRKLLNDPDLARRLGEAGQTAAARRQWSATATATVAFYRKVLS